MPTKNKSYYPKDERIEEASLAELKKLSNVFNNSNYVFGIVSFNGQIKYINSVLPAILGIDRSSIMSQTSPHIIVEYVHPDDVRHSIQAQREAVEKLRICCYENRYRTKDGSYISLSWMLIPIEQEQYYYAIAHNITEQRRIQGLEDERKRLYALLNGLPGLVYLRRLDGNVIFANQNFKNIHGEPDERKCHSILFDRDEPCSYCQSNPLSSANRPNQWQCVIKDTIFDVYQYPFNDFDGTQLFLMQLLDITQQKIAEEEIARLDQLNLVGELAASIAHEVRNPMTTVRGFLQILKSRDIYNENTEYFDLMISELDRANLILTEFLSIAKTKNVQYSPVKLNDLVESLYPLISADAANQDKQVSLELHDVVELSMNEREMRQLILNLTRNGLEAMPIKGLLKIKTFMTDQNVILAVQDEGFGISQEMINQLGTPFLTTKEKGTGLGLTTCYSIAERHGAKINVESSPAGTTFYVHFKIPNS